MCHFHCLVFCRLCNVFCHSLKLTPSPLTLVHCHLAFWWAPNVFHCPINTPPSHSFIILCFTGHLVCFIVLQNPPPLLCLFVMVLCFNQPLTCFITLQTQIPPFTCDRCHLIFLCFIWCFFLSYQTHPTPIHHHCCFIFFEKPKSHCWMSFLFMKCDPSPYYVLLVLWIITLSLQPIPFGLWRVIHSSCFSQFVKPKSLVSFLLVCGFWSTCFVFLGFRNLIPLPYYFLFMKVDTFVLFILFVLMFLKPKPLAWLSCSPPPPTLSCKHLFLTSLLQQCYNMSFHLQSNPCPYFGFSLIFYYTPKDHLFIPKKVGP
jgi:hypothetical protein